MAVMSIGRVWGPQGGYDVRWESLWTTANAAMSIRTVWRLSECLHGYMCLLRITWLAVMATGVGRGPSE